MSAEKQLSRRAFLRASAMTAVGIVAASCAQPTPQVVERQVQVEKVVKETVVVEKQVPIEKVVKETVVVEKQVQIEQVVMPAFNQSPMLAAQVKAGELPPVEERLPVSPVVVVPPTIGKFGGIWRTVWRGPSDSPNISNHLRYVRHTRLYFETGFELYPDVCDSWEVGKEGKDFTYHIREGVKWSDGTPFTSEDVMFWWDDLMNNTELTPSISGTLKASGKPPTVTASDAYTFKVTYESAYGIFAVQNAANAGAAWFGLMSPKHYMQQFHAGYVDKANLDAAIKAAGLETWIQLYGERDSWFQNADKPVLTPWAPESSPDETGRAVWIRNPYFYRVDPDGNQLPYIDRVEYTQASSPDIAVLMAAGGEVDLQIRYYRETDFTPLKSNESQGGYRVVPFKEYRGNTDATLEFNLTYNQDPVLRDIFRDVRFRQAASLAMNRDEILMVQFLGLGTARQASFPGGSPYYDDEWANWYAEYDPGKANALLDEMGLTQRDSDGFRLRPDGKTLEVIFEFASSGGQSSAMEELQKEYLDAIGIKTILQPRERTLYTERETANEVMLGRWSFGANELGLAGLLPNQRWGRLWQIWLATDGADGEEPPADVLRIRDLIDVAYATGDDQERKSAIEEMIAIWKKNLWVIGTVGENPRAGVISNRMKNVREGLPYGGYLSIPCPYADQFFFES